ncbi:MAG: NAD-dependent epimerase/dehydratase family protein [Pseudomonadota bacterium]|nr:NAD-dependent epimerase/dehydratase family protein [Pseudomonadota bacterium]
MAAKEVVIVTGSSGYLGGAIIRRLADKYTVVGLDRAGGKAPSECATQIEFDLGSDESVRDALEKVRTQFGGRIASVIHLASYYDITGNPNPLYDKITVQGTRRLVDGLQDFKVDQFVFASTLLVHQPTKLPDERISEDSPVAPSWAYPESKLKTEELLRARHGDIPVVLLRIAGVYDDTGHSAFLAEQIAGVYEHRTTAHLYPGMLCAAQSSVHLDDLTDAVARLVERRKELPAELPLLIGEPEALGYAEIQDIVHCEIHGEDWTTVRIPKGLAKIGAWLQNEVLGQDQFVQQWMIDEASSHYIVDIDRARRLIGWEPRHSLRERLPKIIAALKADPQRWYKANKLHPAVVAWHGEKAAPAGAHDEQKGHAGADGKIEDGGHSAAATGHDHMAMMAADEKKVRWVHYTNIGLGMWLAASVFVYDAMTTANVSDAVRSVTADRGLPSVEWRASALVISDIVSGLLISLFGALSLSKRTSWWAQWAVTFVGLWLLFAPMIFWTPSAAQYLNDTLVGSAVIAFSVLVPMMPGMDMKGMMDPKSIPPGWTYSPSTFAQRLPMVFLGLIGLLISRILTAYQLGHIDSAWEPFFAGSAADPKNGTEEIITSWVSKAWPVPDAALGAVSYLLEILMAVMGGRDRWRTMPWMVTFFGILVIPLGVVSIYFIVIQPVLLGTWSTPALIAALAMLVMIPFAIDEVIAMGQYLYWSERRGRPLIRTFFKGGPVEGGQEDHSDALASPSAFWSDTIRGITLPWTLAATTVLGALLMLERLMLPVPWDLANMHHVIGALVVTVSVIATAEVARALRFVNLLFAAWLAASPWLAPESSVTATVVSIAGAALIAALSLPRGRRSKDHYAGWDRFVV